jgi:cell pole-organizing protein PopZ
MSAASPSYDRDLEALHRAQRAYEPSMEEILASIRNIIADEKPSIAPLADESAEADLPARQAAGEPALAVSALAALSDGQLPPHIPRVVWQQPTVARAPASVASPAATADENISPSGEAVEEPLISRETDAAVSHSFETLAVGLVAQNPALVEGIVREMIRPMLKTWLDDNLPSVVERLVRAEIQRVARGGRGGAVNPD